MDSKTLVLLSLLATLSFSQTRFFIGADGADGEDVFKIIGPALAGNGGDGQSVHISNRATHFTLLHPSNCRTCDFSPRLKPDFFTFAEETKKLIGKLTDTIQELQNNIGNLLSNQADANEKMVKDLIYKRPAKKSCACCPGSGNIWVKPGLGGKGGKATSQHGIAIDGEDGKDGTSIVNLMGFSPCCCERTCGTTCGGGRQCGAGCGCTFGH